MRLARLRHRRVPLGSFFRRTGRAACIVWPAPESVPGPDAFGRAGTAASGTAPTSPRKTAAMKEADMSRTTGPGGRDRCSGDRPAGGRGLPDLHPPRLMPARARGRSLMRVRALQAQPDARSRPRWRRRLLIAGDAALALALAALAVASPAPGDGPRIGPAAIALALLQTLPLAFRRWRPVWVLAGWSRPRWARRSRPRGARRSPGTPTLLGRFACWWRFTR